MTDAHDDHDGYGLDLSKISLARFQQMLETGDLLPSRRILKERLAERFAVLEERGIENLQQLADVLKTKKHVARLAEDAGLPQDYLVILRREARSYIPTPVYFKDIPGVDPQVVARLAELGIRQTRQLYNGARTPAERAELAERAGVPGDALLELVKMSDLARAGWVGPVFVRMIYETGADTLSALAQQSPEDLYARLLAVNREQPLTRASFSVQDVAACIETAQALPPVVTYVDQADSPGGDGRKGRVLVLNDDNLMRMAIGDLLEEAGYASLGAGDNQEALALLQEGQAEIDLFIQDIQRPEVDGWTLYGQLKADPVLRDVPVLFVSAAWADELAGRLLGPRDQGLALPFDADELLACVQRILEG
jgi:CheY-like chemotaxis protein